MSVRSFRPEDAEGVRRVIKAVYDEYQFTWEPERYHSDLWKIEDLYMNASSHFWVAELDGEVVGCIGLKSFEAVPGEPGSAEEHQGKIRVSAADCELTRLYVVKRARGQKLGIALTKACLDHAAETGHKVMEIWSDKLFKEAHQLYARFGAVNVGERICDDPDEAPEWGMMIDLTSRQAEAKS
jgi:GNAT superfamily N-acetyltransferase